MVAQLAPTVLSALALAFPGHRIAPVCGADAGNIGSWQWDNGPTYVAVSAFNCRAANAFQWAEVPANNYGIEGLLEVTAAYEIAWRPIYSQATARVYAVRDFPRVVRAVLRAPKSVPRRARGLWMRSMAAQIVAEARWIAENAWSTSAQASSVSGAGPEPVMKRRAAAYKECNEERSSPRFDRCGARVLRFGLR